MTYMTYKTFIISGILGRIKLWTEYKPCLRPFPRQLYSIVLSSARRQSKKICLSKESRVEVVDALKCVSSSNESFSDAQQIGHQITSFVTYLVNISDINHVIPSLCCGYRVMLNHAIDTLNDMCGRQHVDDEKSKYLVAMIENILSDAIDMMCSTYQTIEICHEKVPRLMYDMEMNMNETLNVTYNYSAVVPILDMINRIDAETNIRNI